MVTPEFLGNTASAGDWITVNYFTVAYERNQRCGSPEGHYASAMFNTVRGFSSIAAGVLVEWFINDREQFHSNVLVNNVANRPWLISTPVSEQASSSIPLLHDGSISNTENIAGFITLLKHQAIVLSLADSYLLMTGFAVLLLLLTVWLPKRVWPPQTLFNLQ